MLTFCVGAAYGFLGGVIAVALFFWRMQAAPSAPSLASLERVHPELQRPYCERELTLARLERAHCALQPGGVFPPAGWRCDQ